MKFKLILFIFLIVFFRNSYAEKLTFNIDHKVVNKAVFDTENNRNIINLYHNNNNLITKIPSFDEDGGNRFEKVLTRYDENNLIRIITTFSDRGYFKIYYDIGLNKDTNLYILNKVSFETQEWSSNEKFTAKYCYSQFQIGLDELSKNNELFNEIRPRVDGWENGKVKGSCVKSNNEINYENAYNLVIKSYLFNKPNVNEKTKMYLVKGDVVNLLKMNNEFYYIEYITPKNKTIKKWLHCSAIDACVY
ncbi:hypothetical protein [Gilliamella intestini]|uniref:Uncharacterized protein n=1 Tax=Gilliamella intestini TaxID=1798183 RepID=A0A1C4CWC9_9GAMM|nr:hypothetical protein [Gilliamella intestini]SCC23340.1 hypothetical protein GA0061080_105113 [Gilliamella intestini]